MNTYMRNLSLQNGMPDIHSVDCVSSFFFSFLFFPPLEDLAYCCRWDWAPEPIIIAHTG